MNLELIVLKADICLWRNKIDLKSKSKSQFQIDIIKLEMFENMFKNIFLKINYL